MRAVSDKTGCQPLGFCLVNQRRSACTEGILFSRKELKDWKRSVSQDKENRDESILIPTWLRAQCNTATKGRQVPNFFDMLSPPRDTSMFAVFQCNINHRLGKGCRKV